MTETPPTIDLAALEQAARESDDPWVAESAYDKLSRELIRAYRAKQLVLIGPDDVETMKTALLAARFSDGEHMVEEQGNCSAEMIADYLAAAALAALGVK